MSIPKERPEKIASKTGSPQSGEPVYLAIAKLRRTHGLKGEILMDALTDFPERIKKGNTVFTGPKHTPRIIDTFRPTNKEYLISFDGITDCDQATILRNQLVFIKKELAEGLPEGEFYHHEVKGMDVFDENGINLGKVDEILVTGANDVYVIHASDGAEILIPAIKSVILSIQRENRKMIVRLPEWE
jgi:16S rRNA processing protein RimM